MSKERQTLFYYRLGRGYIDGEKVTSPPLVFPLPRLWRDFQHTVERGMGG